MNTVSVYLAFSSYPDQNINKYKYFVIGFPVIAVFCFVFRILKDYLNLNLYSLHCN